MDDYSVLAAKAHKLRKDVLDTCVELKEAHLGGCYSMIEMLLVLHDKIITNKDIFILSKAHASFPHLLLLREKGFNPKMTTHLEIDPKNGIPCTTGSLGHGLPIGAGMALARKIQEKEGYVYVLMSDGEMQEGTTWETMQIAAHHKLNNLVVVIDYNKIQALMRVDETCKLGNLVAKFKVFNWDCEEVKDGHNFSELISVLSKKPKNKPLVIIVHTTKGKGVSYIEDDPKWHARKLKGEELEMAYKELQ